MPGISKSSARTLEKVPVLVVGSGPSGLVTALSLARLGVRSIVVTKYAGFANSPRAHITNQRTFEILADLGVAEAVGAAGDLLEETPYILYGLSLAAPELARSTGWGAGQNDKVRYQNASRHLSRNVFQHIFEPMLAEAAVATGLVDLRFQNEFLTFKQDADGVDTVIMDHVTGHEYGVRADYLVGADGARSKVLSQAGLSVRGETDLARFLFIWVNVDLTKYFAHRPSSLYWSVVPGYANWTLVNRFNEWVAGFILPETGVPNDEEALAMVRKAIGDPRLDKIEIKGKFTWSLNHAAADVYSAGRVHCVGDAVHQHPPTNGLGSNTSIADGYNLAWKLHLVLAGKAGPRLLETYSVERAPVGRQIVDRAFKSAGELFTVGASVGIRPDMSDSEKFAAIRAVNEATPEAAALRAALADAMKFMDYNFNAHGVELGYRYDSAAVVRDRLAEGDLADLKTLDEIIYVPSTAPGEHLPHAFLERNGRKISTHDIAGHGRFTIITGRGGQAWGQAAERASRELGLQVNFCIVGTIGGYRDPLGDWEKLRQIDDDGCLLVRPDLFIAWRSKTTLDPDRLFDALLRVLDRAEMA
jgi:2,4-dichlorophenol 6-monooxygenase